MSVKLSPILHWTLIDKHFLSRIRFLLHMENLDLFFFLSDVPRFFKDDATFQKPKYVQPLRNVKSQKSFLESLLTGWKCLMKDTTRNQGNTFRELSSILANVWSQCLLHLSHSPANNSPSYPPPPQPTPLLHLSLEGTDSCVVPVTLSLRTPSCLWLQHNAWLSVTTATPCRIALCS